MASRGKKKSPAQADGKALAAVADGRENWKKYLRKYAFIITAVLIVAFILQMPYSWNGFVTVKIDGSLVIESQMPDFGQGSSGSDTSEEMPLSFRVPVNTWDVMFAPAYCNSAVNFLTVKIVDSMDLEYSRELGFVEDNTTINLTSSMQEKVSQAGVAALVMSYIVNAAFIAMVTVAVLSAAGKIRIKAAWITSMVYLAVTVILLCVAIVMSTVNMTLAGEKETTVAVAVGGEAFLAIIAGAAVVTITSLFRKKTDRAYADYVDIMQAVGKK